jgi:hypothetical protein
VVTLAVSVVLMWSAAAHADDAIGLTQADRWTITHTDLSLAKAPVRVARLGDDGPNYWSVPPELGGLEGAEAEATTTARPWWFPRFRASQEISVFAWGDETLEDEITSATNFEYYWRGIRFGVSFLASNGRQDLAGSIGTDLAAIADSVSYVGHRRPANLPDAVRWSLAHVTIRVMRTFVQPRTSVIVGIPLVDVPLGGQ